MGDVEETTGADEFPIRDEKDYEGGGFDGPLGDDDDVPPKAPPDNEEAGQGGDTPDGVKQREPEAPAGQDLEPPETPQEEETPPPEEEDDPQFALFKQLEARNEQLAQAVTGINNQVQLLQQTLLQNNQQPKEEKPKPGAELTDEEIKALPGMPTDSDWNNDPTEAAAMVARAIARHERERIDQMLDSKVGEISKTQQSAVALKAEQDKAWAAAVKACPELMDETSDIRKATEQIYADDSLGFANTRLDPTPPQAWPCSSRATSSRG
jgi:hypothetical protein